MSMVRQFASGLVGVSWSLCLVATGGWANDTSPLTSDDVDHSKAAACGNPKLATQAMPADIEMAFPNLEIGRPILIHHAGDGSGRLFIASQYGVLYTIDPTDREVSEPKVFFDFSEAVTYKDRENEEGLLGMAFHPQFKSNGKFYLFFTSSEKPRLSAISEFTVSRDNKVDRGSEVRILEIPQPAWNHNGGTIEFGPDGYLYIALGDGGGANDMFKNGQNLGTLMGSILRIDVDKPSQDAKYSIPADNPFVDTAGARPEIWAYGLRNVWRMSFDPSTKLLWAADVGQDLWEEIDLIERGGNYGWSKREGMHPFGPEGAGPSADFIEPIWEYHHDLGKSITGGLVYRGTAIPELQGVYLYADYVSGKMWGIRYDETQKKVTAHYELPLPGNVPVITFGTDQDGEVYFSDPAGRIFKFVPKTASVR
ncbi:MAG: PQQ-dependent sugar dehydrogenase [Planctomycetaceae bacterium]|nr:PQQ-dependent sugar dehydrogenase [Planctomycetaceae bacterium]